MVPAGAPRNLFASRDFIILHLDLVDLVGLDAALLFQRIAWRCEGRDGWPATHADLCAETRLTEHRVKQALGVLRERGWITGERADRFQPTLTWRVVWETDAVTEDFPVTSRSVAPAPVTEDFPVSTSLREQVETGKDIPQPQLAVVATDDLATDFATFWDLYPRKVGKGQAVKAYRAALKNADAATILAGLTAQLPVLRAREAAYVPHASTWLNGQRWADDVAALQAPSLTGRRNYDLERMQARHQGQATSADAALAYLQTGTIQ